MEVEAVPILRVADADVAVRWYERLGFTKQWEYRFDQAAGVRVDRVWRGAAVLVRAPG